MFLGRTYTSHKKTICHSATCDFTAIKLEFENQKHVKPYHKRIKELLSKTKFYHTNIEIICF